MPIGLLDIGFTPDLGMLPFDDHFDDTKNNLLVIVPLSELVPGADGPEDEVNGPNQLTINLDGTYWTVPTAVWRRFRPGRKRTIYWCSGLGAKGSFRFFPEAPPVF